jgi:hypothetical protein
MATNSQAYPEIKLPIDFVAKFEKNKDMSVGAVTYAAREI